MKTIRSIIAISAMALALSGCSVFNGAGGIFGKSDKKDVSDAQVVENTTTEKRDHNTAAKPDGSRHESGADKHKSDLAGLLDGEWVITAIGDARLPQYDEMPYVNFEESAGRFYASNGCNILNGNYKLAADNKITFSGVLSTMKECGDDEFERAISNILKDGVNVKAGIEKKGVESYLYFDNRAGKRVMTLRKHNMEPLNGLWRVERIGRDDVKDSGLDIFIDVSELKTHGNTGCNYFNGEIVIDPSAPSAISFSQMAVTMRMCENSEVERAYLVALEETVSYSLVGNTLHFMNEKGHTVLVLKRQRK